MGKKISQHVKAIGESFDQCGSKFKERIRLISTEAGMDLPIACIVKQNRHIFVVGISIYKQNQNLREQAMPTLKC